MSSYDKIRKLIERRYRRRIVFGFHFTAFVVALAATASWITTHWVYPGDWKNMWYLVGWGFLLFLHWAYFRLANARDREIEAAWERFGGEVPQGKSKWDEGNWHVLSDDGERFDWTDEPGDLREKLKRR